MKYIFLLLFSCLFRVSCEAVPVPLRDQAQVYDLFRASSLLEVKPGQVPIESLLQSPGRYRFVPTKNQLIRPNDHQKAYWFRVEVTNETPDDFFLHFVYSGTERITVYEVADNRIVATRSLGRLVAEPRDFFRYSKLFYPMQVRQDGPAFRGPAFRGPAFRQTHTLYIYMEGIYTTCLYFDARSATNLIGLIHTEDLFYGLYYGFILIVVVYSLLLFLRLGEQDTLRYAIWVSCIGLQLALYRGFTAEFLWSSNPAFERYANALGGITGLLHVLFTMAFSAPANESTGLLQSGSCGHWRLFAGHRHLSGFDLRSR